MRWILIVLLLTPLALAADFNRYKTQNELPYDEVLNTQIYAANGSTVQLTSDNPFLVFPAEIILANTTNSTSVQINLSIPENASVGNYTQPITYDEKEITFNITIQKFIPVTFESASNGTGGTYFVPRNYIKEFNDHQRYQDTFTFLTGGKITLACSKYLVCPEFLQGKQGDIVDMVIIFDIPDDLEEGPHEQYAYLKREGGSDIGLTFKFEIIGPKLPENMEECEETLLGGTRIRICQNKTVNIPAPIQETDYQSPEILHRVVYPQALTDSINITRKMNQDAMNAVKDELDKKDAKIAELEKRPTWAVVEAKDDQIAQLNKTLHDERDINAAELEGKVSKAWRSVFIWFIILGLLAGAAYFVLVRLEIIRR